MVWHPPLPRSGFFALLLAGTVLFQGISEDIQKNITIRDSLVSIADLKG